MYLILVSVRSHVEYLFNILNIKLNKVIVDKLATDDKLNALKYRYLTIKPSQA